MRTSTNITLPVFPDGFDDPNALYQYIWLPIILLLFCVGQGLRERGAGDEGPNSIPSFVQRNPDDGIELVDMATSGDPEHIRMETPLQGNTAGEPGSRLSDAMFV